MEYLHLQYNIVANKAEHASSLKSAQSSSLSKC